MWNDCEGGKGSGATVWLSSLMNMSDAFKQMDYHVRTHSRKNGAGPCVVGGWKERERGRERRGAIVLCAEGNPIGASSLQTADHSALHLYER